MSKTNENNAAADAGAAELRTRIAALEGEREDLLKQVASAETKAMAARSATEAELEEAKRELAQLRERYGESCVAQQAAQLDLEKLQGRRVRIKIPFGEGEMGKQPVKVGVNGTYHCTIPRGVPAVVPAFVLPVLNDAVEDTYSMAADSLGRARGLGDATPVQRFPYQVLGVVEE